MAQSSEDFGGGRTIDERIWEDAHRAYGYDADPDEGLDDPERYRAVEDER